MPAEVRCPTCGRQTPVAPFCTFCGGALPEGAVRPRGLDRQELEERIRARRTGDNPFLRGSGDRTDGPAVGGGPVFVPAPEDALARREHDGVDPEVGHVDHFNDATQAGGWGASELDDAGRPEEPRYQEPRYQEPRYQEPRYQEPRRDDPPPVAPVPDPAPTPPRGVPVTPPDRAEPRYDEPRYDRPRYDERYDDYGAAAGAAAGLDAAADGAGGAGGDDGYREGYGYAERYGDEPPRRTGVGAVLGFVVLGIAALLGGAILFSIINSGSGVAQSTPTPTPTATVSAEATPGDTTGASESPSASAGESAGGSATPAPSAVPADFSAEVQPCATSAMNFKGCAKDGSTISGSQVWIWARFTNGRATDVMSVDVLDASGTSVGDGSLELSKIGCDPDKPCTGYIQMNFGGLSSGRYDIKVSLNGVEVTPEAFSVS